MARAGYARLRDIWLTLLHQYVQDLTGGRPTPVPDYRVEEPPQIFFSRGEALQESVDADEDTLCPPPQSDMEGGLDGDAA